MSQYYNARRTKYLFDPESKWPFELSRSKLDLFLNCPRCFYMDRRLGVAQPPGYPFSLNSAVDILLKKEFDIHRAKETRHPLMEHYGVDAVPLRHEQMNEWRDALRGGIKFLHQPTNLLVKGGIDDVWVNPRGELIIVDYKSTAKSGEITLEADWQIGYKRQMEIYQWLARHNDELKKYQISDTGYFVYCNGRTDREAFDGKLEFDIKIIPYIGDNSWVEETIFKAHDCLSSEAIPKANPTCDYCRYVKARKEE